MVHLTYEKHLSPQEILTWRKFRSEKAVLTAALTMCMMDSAGLEVTCSKITVSWAEA